MKRSSMFAAAVAISTFVVPALGAAQDEAATEEAAVEETAVSVDATGVEGDGAAPSTGGLSVGALLGYGVDFEDGDLNPFGFTLGGRAGYTLSNNLYVGGTAVFHVGDSEDAGGVEASFRMLQLGPEIGYDIALAPVIIRPYAGLGLNFAFVSTKIDVLNVDESDTETDFYLNIGGEVLYPIDNFFVGGDLRLMNVFADETLTGLLFAATAGINI